MLVRVRPQTPGDMVATSSIGSDNADPLPENNSFSLSTRVDPLPVLTIRWWTNQVRVGWPVGLNGTCWKPIRISWRQIAGRR